MDFTNEQLTDFNDYVADNNLHSYIRSLLNDIVCASVRLRTAIRSVRELSMSCFEINRAYSQMGVRTIKVTESVANISARAALGEVVSISVQEVSNA